MTGNPPGARDRSSPGLKLLVGIVLGAGALAAFLSGPRPLLVFLVVLYVLAFVELRRILAHETGSTITLVLGAAAVVAFSWLASERGTRDLPWVMAALLGSVMVVRILLVEVGVSRPEGATLDVASTTAAAGIIGLLGAHLFLIRSTPRFGFRGTLVFGLMVLLNDGFAFIVGRIAGRHPLAPRVSPSKTWEGAFAGTLATMAVGLVAGYWLDPPFTPTSGVVLGAIIAVLAPVGDLAESALKRGAGLKDSASYVPGQGGALDVLDDLLFCAPFFYWAFRTLVI